jgi:hypothetical protein
MAVVSTDSGPRNLKAKKIFTTHVFQPNCRALEDLNAVKMVQNEKRYYFYKLKFTVEHLGTKIGKSGE